MEQLATEGIEEMEPRGQDLGNVYGRGLVLRYLRRLLDMSIEIMKNADEEVDAKDGVRRRVDESTATKD